LQVPTVPEYCVRRCFKKREAFLGAILLAGVVAATWCSAGTAAFNGFRGAFLRVLLGYAVLITLAHFVYLFLPKFGIGGDLREGRE
jgi:hypothetical protein